MFGIFDNGRSIERLLNSRPEPVMYEYRVTRPTSVSSTLGSNTDVYPCTFGTGTPRGFHKFACSDSGVVYCELCGKAADR